MSAIEDGRRVRCDEAGCGATARLPVGLRPLLAANGDEALEADGWLFVAAGGWWRHYCPAHAQNHLGAFTGEAGKTD